MTIETKFLIGLLLLMIIGSFMVMYFDPSDTTFSTFQQSMTEFGDSFHVISYTSLVNIIVTGGEFLLDTVRFFGQCIMWNFAFFNEFAWLRVILICINLAIISKFMVDIYRSFKPFGG